MAYSRRKSASSYLQSSQPSPSAMFFDASPQFPLCAEPRTSGANFSPELSGINSWSPYRVRRTSYVIATASSPGTGTGPSTLVETVGFKRITDIDEYCPSASLSSGPSKTAASDEHATHRSLMPYDNFRCQSLTPAEIGLSSVVRPLSGVASPINYDVEEAYSNPENSNRMWNIFDVDGDGVRNEFCDEEIIEENDQEEYALNQLTRSPQRKNSYYEATHTADDRNAGGSHQPETELLTQRMSAVLSANHASVVGSDVGIVENSTFDNCWFSCGQTGINDFKTVTHSVSATGCRETEMILFPLGKESSGLVAVSEGEATVSADLGSIDDSGGQTTSIAASASATRRLVVVSLSFVLVFSSFRSVQSLESSLNSVGGLGVITMACAHLSMCLTCHVTPRLVQRLSSKWTLVLGVVLYMAWIAANMAPHPYTLLPTALGVGFGQSLVWSAQVRSHRLLTIISPKDRFSPPESVLSRHPTSTKEKHYLQ
jgi:hypothetical protein